MKDMSKYFKDFLNEQLKDEEARKDKNITQKELADLTGITQGDIQEHKSFTKNIKKLAAVFQKKLVTSFE